MNNQTATNPLLAFSTPEKVVINGRQITHPQLIKAYIKVIAENPERMQALVFSIINGVVKLYITVDAAI